MTDIMAELNQKRILHDIAYDQLINNIDNLSEIMIYKYKMNIRTHNEAFIKQFKPDFVIKGNIKCEDKIE